MKTVLLDMTGSVIKQDMTRAELLKYASLPIRDLRPILSPRQVHTMLVRNKTIVGNLADIGFLLKEDSILLTSQSTNNILSELQKLIHSTINIPLKDDVQPYFIRILDAVFTYATGRLELKYEALSRQAENIQAYLSSAERDIKLEQLLSIKKRISKLETDLEEYLSLLNTFLDDEEEMRLLFLEDTDDEEEIVIDELQSILENALEQVEQMAHQCADISENLDDTQDILTLKLQQRRTTLTKIDLFMTVLTTIFSSLAVLVGAFGMNLTSHLESNIYAFWIVFMIIIAFFIIGLYSGYRYLKAQKVV